MSKFEKDALLLATSILMRPKISDDIEELAWQVFYGKLSKS